MFFILLTTTPTTKRQKTKDVTEIMLDVSKTTFLSRPWSNEWRTRGRITKQTVVVWNGGG